MAVVRYHRTGALNSCRNAVPGVLSAVLERNDKLKRNVWSALSFWIHSVMFLCKPWLIVRVFMHMHYAQGILRNAQGWWRFLGCVSFGAIDRLTELHLWCHRHGIGESLRKEGQVWKNNELLTHQSPFSEYTGTHRNKSHVYRPQSPAFRPQRCDGLINGGHLLRKSSEGGWP